MSRLFLNYKKIPKLLQIISIIILTLFIVKLINERSNESSNNTEIKANHNTEVIDANKTSNISVEDYLNIILSSPKESSNPMDYIEAHQEEYNAILEKDIEALPYLFSEFEKGEQTGLKGVIMKSLCRRILRGENIKYASTSPQDWYNAIKEYTIAIATKNSYEFVKENNPKIALILDKENYYYAYDMVNFSDGMVEIAGQKLGYEKVDLGPLYETLTGKQIEQLMYRAVIYYKSVFHKDFAAVKRFSSVELKEEIDKWNKNEEVRSGIEVIMTLNNLLDVAFPNGIKAPIQYNDNFVVILLIDGTTSAHVTFVINTEGEPEVTDFQLSSI